MRLFPLVFILIIIVVFVSTKDSAAEQLNSGGLFEGTGFVITGKTIQHSLLDIEFASQDNKIVKDGIISIGEDDFLFSDQWKGKIVQDGRFLIFSGSAENSKNESIDVSLFGRLIGTNEKEAVYTFSGKIEDGDKSSKISYISKMTNFANAEKEQAKTEIKSIQIDILPGASKPGNAKYYSLTTTEITPGTTIVWKNNDSVPHRIMSGISSSYPGKPFTSDGKINSGEILPGKTFQITINDMGITRYSDTKYDWMDGIILSFPETENISLKRGSSR